MMNRAAHEIFLVVILVVGSAPAHLAQAEESPKSDIATLAALLELVIDADAESARSCLQKIAEQIRTSEIEPARITALKERLGTTLGKFVADSKHPLHNDAILLSALWNDAAAGKAVAALARRETATSEQRQLAVATLIAAKDPAAISIAADFLARRDAAARPLQFAALTALSRADDPAVATAVLRNYPQLAADSQAAAMELLTQRAAWSKLLLAEIAAGRVPQHALNVNHARKLLSLGDRDITQAVTRVWGTLREGRDPKREQFVGQMRKLIRETPGDARRGILVFNKVCGQCHKIHGQGQDVGPDITSNGRASFEQLLSNVFDPSLVIGASYQARTVRTIDGRVVTGLLVEDSDQRVTLKLQGGKLETIAKDDVDAMKVSELSLMPEGLEKQLQPQEIADLFAFITLDKHPEDPQARPIPAGSR
jgi:putative heme-binding domain-containing protein